MEFVAASEAEAASSAVASSAPQNQSAAPADTVVAVKSNEPMTKDQIRAARRAERQKQALEKRMAQAAQKKKANGRAVIRNTGTLVERRPLTPWEQYAQALLFSNELVYVN